MESYAVLFRVCDQHQFSKGNWYSNINVLLFYLLHFSKFSSMLDRCITILLCDNPQEQGITVAPLNVEVRYRSAWVRRKSYLFPTTKVSQVLVDYALNKFIEQCGWFNGWKFDVTKQECESVPILFNARGQDKGTRVWKCPNPL